ncbi:MAG: sugar phosphate isomerase/epimerase [Fervidobacterium sp.]|nr:sugar phosphate isomerase/epimerase [Fervidobacterium sp.]
MGRKVISTSLIRANIEKLNDLPSSKNYELTFFKENDLSKILEFLHTKSATFGLHAPFIYRYKQTHPFPTSTIDELRKDTYEKNYNCAILAKNIGAEYVVIHFPNARQSENWIVQQKIVHEAVEAISQLNQIIPVRIENIYMNDYFHSPEDYTWFTRQTNTTLCVDIGHLLIDSEIYNFDPVKFIDKCAEYISEFHLYYADLNVYNQCHHAPWGDSKDFLRTLDFIRNFKCDFTVEASNDCKEGLEKLLRYVEEVTEDGDGDIRI